MESQYQDALRALDADRETLRREVERVIAADAAREGEHASLRDRCAELERELEDARAAAADPNDDDDDDRRQRQPATLAMVRRLRRELTEARAAAAEAARAQVDKIQTLSFSGAPDETELSAVRVEIDRTRAEMAAALGEVSAAAKDRDDALEEVRVELGVLQAERMRLRTRVDSFGKKLQAESTSRGPRRTPRVFARGFETSRRPTRLSSRTPSGSSPCGSRRARSPSQSRRMPRGRRRRRTPCDARYEPSSPSSSWRGTGSRRSGNDARTRRRRRSASGGAEEARRVAEEATAAKTKSKAK